MKKLDVSIFMMVFLIWLCSGCHKQPTPLTEPPAPVPEVPSITPMVINCLDRLHEEAMQQNDADIASLDSQIGYIESKELELEQLKNKIDETVAAVDQEIAQKKLETGGWWVFSLPEDEIDNYKNDYYELVQLDLRWDARMEERIWELKKDITVRDRETSNEGIPQVFLEELRWHQGELIAVKEAKIEEKEVSDSVLSDVIKHVDDWELDEISKGVYEVGGYGLGYTGQLSIGEWFYYEESNSIEPKTQSAISLRDVLTGH